MKEILVKGEYAVYLITSYKHPATSRIIGFEVLLTQNDEFCKEIGIGIFGGMYYPDADDVVLSYSANGSRHSLILHNTYKAIIEEAIRNELI